MTDFKKMVLGNAGAKKSPNPFKALGGKKKKAAKKAPKRKKKGNWDTMYGGAEDPELKKKRKDGNFWVDTTSWF